MKSHIERLKNILHQDQRYPSPSNLDYEGFKKFVENPSLEFAAPDDHASLYDELGLLKNNPMYDEVLEWMLVQISDSSLWSVKRNDE